MIAVVTLVLSVSLVDPRPALVELQLAGRHQDALSLAESELSTRPEETRGLGLDYLRGHLLDTLGQTERSAEAFAAAMVATPELAHYSRYRLALDQERMGHPEVAAGLVAGVVDSRPPALLPEAARMLARTLTKGGDCRLLGGLRLEDLPARERRVLTLAQADCALRAGSPELARGILVKLLEESRDDDSAQAAAERLAGMVAEGEAGKMPLLLGQVFHQHREFERALRFLRRALDPAEGLSDGEVADGRYAQGRSHFWQERYAPAAVVFGGLAHVASRPAERARALYQQGRSYELLGHWDLAAESFRRAYLAETDGEWAGAALISVLRLQWRTGNEAEALALYDKLASRREWRDHALRAALFLASSDLVRGRADRAGDWLARAGAESWDERLEVAYWRGRLAELQGEAAPAVEAYLEALRLDVYHPLAQSARQQLAAPRLARTAAAEARRRTASGRFDGLHEAWLLLGNGSETGRAAWLKARDLLLAERGKSPFVRLAEVPVRGWPLWQDSLRRPEEKLLALGILHEGAPAVRAHFPVGEPSLAFTGARLLSRAGEHERAIQLADTLRLRAGDRVPLVFQPRELHELLYPAAWWDTLTAQSGLRGVPPSLLASIVREESRFDPLALSPAAARGLGQFTLPTARRIAADIQMSRLDPEDLYRPEVSLALGAAYLAQLLKDFDGAMHVSISAYNAGEPQAALWRSYCFSPEREEFFSKVGFKETRAYLRRVLTSLAHYEELY